MTQPIIPIEPIQRLVQTELGLIIFGLALFSWVFYKLFLRGLTAERISIETRIITVADIFDAITADRPYRGPIPVDQAIAMMEKERDAAIDGDCLDALKRALPELGF